MMGCVNEAILVDVNGKFEKYYYQFVPQILSSIDNIEINGVIGDGDSKQRCIEKLTRGVVKQLSEVSTLSLLDFFQQSTLSYFDFNQKLLEREFVDSFHAKYPLVLSKVNIIIRNCISRFEEIFSIVSNFKQDIKTFLNSDESFIITDINTFEGDFHKDTFVAILTIEGKKIVLKKRTNLGEQCLNIFLKYFESESISIPVIRTQLLSDTLCLQEFVTPYQNWENREIKDYYYKFGIMTAIFTVLGTKDLHSENVIATQKGPCFIDLEAAITSKLETKSYSLLKESFLFNSNEERIVYSNTDLSAFSGDNVQLTDLEIINLGKDNIGLALISKEIERNNIPRDKQNKKINPYKYVSEVLSGYREGMRVIKKFQDEIISDLKEIENYEYRIVLRNTGFYAKYLKDLTFPTYTKSYQKSRNYLKLLSKVSVRNSEILNEEMVCLEENIIPYFTTNLFFDSKSIKTEFINRLVSFNDEIECKEEYYLKLILNIIDDEKNQQEMLTAKDRINYEVNQFIDFCSNKTIFCYGTVDLTIHNRLMNYRNDIFTFGGSLLFVNSFLKSSTISQKVKNTVINSKSHHHISGLTGYQSELFLKYLLGIEQDYSQYITVNEMMNPHDIIDFSTYGSAIIILNILYQDSLSEKLLIDIKLLGEKYLNNLKNQKLTGFFHGYAGDCLVLNTLYEFMDKQVIVDTLYQSLTKENSSYLREEGNWVDKRETEKKKGKNLFALSYGTPGILLSRLFLLLNKDLPADIKQIASKDIETGVEAILEKERCDYLDDTLINGFAGSIFVLKLIENSGVLFQKEELVEQIREYIIAAKEKLSIDEWNYQYSSKNRNLNFFNGSLGTAFVLFLLSDKEFELDFTKKIFGVQTYEKD